MKEHFCPAEQSTITYQDKCNWCGESEGSMNEILEMAREAGGQVTAWVNHSTIQKTTTFTFKSPLDYYVSGESPEKYHIKFLEAFANLVAAKTLAQRTWVGLTAEQMRECNMDGDFMVDRETAKLNVQAKLKELNT